MDDHGNPVGAAVTIPLAVSGSTQLRDTRLREAVTALLDFAKTTAGTVMVEGFNFDEGKTREKYGRSKVFRHLIAGFPTSAFAVRLAAMAGKRGVSVVAVDPACTSKNGARAWMRQLSRNTSTTSDTTAAPKVQLWYRPSWPRFEVDATRTGHRIPTEGWKQAPDVPGWRVKSCSRSPQLTDPR